MPKTLKNNLTPQAVDDLLVVEEIFRKTDFGDTGITSFDLIKNDRGGNSKTFLGLGELGGDSLKIDGVGEIKYDFETDSFEFKPADGFEGGTVEFDYAIQMGNGVVSSATASFKANEILIDFDGEALEPYPSIDSPIQNGYQGFNWNNFYGIAYNQSPDSPGYQALTSPDGDDAAFNGWGNDASISRADDKDFDFLTGSFSSALDAQDVSITAFDDGIQVGEAILSLGAGDVLDVNFLEQTSNGVGSAVFTGTFESIDSLEFDPTGLWFAMDDLVVAVEV